MASAAVLLPGPCPGADPLSLKATEPSAARARETWIAVRFPNLALEVFRQANPGRDGRPFVVFEETHGRQVVYGVCNLGIDQGIMPGMPLNAARVLCAALTVCCRDAAAEARLLDKLAHRLDELTPAISLVHPDALIMEVSRCLRLFGGFDSIWEQVRGHFQCQVVTSSAPTASAALLLARNGREEVISDPGALRSVLGGLPLSGTGLPDALVDRLRKCGLEKLTDLWRLPRADLVRRFGMDLGIFLDRLLGTVRDLRPARVTVTRFYQRLELPAITVSASLLQPAMETLLDRACRFMQGRQSGAEKLVFRLWHESTRFSGGEPVKYTVVMVRSTRAGYRRERFLPQLVEKLDRVVLPDPVREVSLRIDEIVTCRPGNQDMFEPSGRHGDMDWSQLMDILGTRVGDERVYRVDVVPDHRPEYAWKKVRPGTRVQDKSRVPETVCGARPCWLLPEPRRVSASELTRSCHEVESIQGGWWEEQDMDRDYFSRPGSRGSRGWLYRDMGTEQGDGIYLHGLFG